MTEQHPEGPNHLQESRIVMNDTIGIDLDIAPNGRLVVSLDPDKVLGIAVVVDVEGHPDVPQGVQFAHNTMTTASVEREAFCRFLSRALHLEAEGIAK